MGQTRIYPCQTYSSTLRIRHYAMARSGRTTTSSTSEPWSPQHIFSTDAVRKATAASLWTSRMTCQCQFEWEWQSVRLTPQAWRYEINRRQRQILCTIIIASWARHGFQGFGLFSQILVLYFQGYKNHQADRRIQRYDMVKCFAILKLTELLEVDKRIYTLEFAQHLSGMSITRTESQSEFTGLKVNRTDVIKRTR